MDLFEHLALGCRVAFSFANLLYCFMGVFLGTLIGVLPVHSSEYSGRSGIRCDMPGWISNGT
ncbi:MAG: hypothetical protein V2A69_10485 [Pseudomonadota bacterium]